MTRRSVVSGTLAAVALLPPLLWLWPALTERAAPSFRDQGDFFYPLKLYTAGRLRSGELPLWNSLSGMGEPWLANLQSGPLYPPTLLFLIPSAAVAAALFLLLHFGIGAWGARRFLKEEGVSEAGSLVGASLFAASGFAASVSAYWNHFGAWAYLPGIAALARNGLRTRAARLGFAVLVGLQAMAGSPEMTAGTLAAAAVLAACVRPERDGWADPTRGLRLARFGLTTALGLAAAAWALAPFAELALRSDRRAPVSAAEREFGSAGLPAISSLAGVSADASASAYLGSLYLGPAALLAAAAAFRERERRRLVLVLFAVALAGLLLAIPCIPGTWIRAIPPLDRVRYPAKALGMTVFSVSILAGLGADALRFAPPARPAVWRAFAAAGALLILVSRQPLSVRATGGAALVAFAALTWPGESLSALRAAVQALGAIALAASFAAAGRPLFRFAPEGAVRARPQPIAFLAGVPGRVLTPPMQELAAWVLRDARFDSETLGRQREALLGYTNLLQGVRTVRTAAPLATEAAARVAEAIDHAADLQKTAGAVSGRVLWSPFAPAGMGSRKVGEFFRAPLNPYRPRLSVVAGYAIEPDAHRASKRLLAGQVDWDRRVQLDREPHLERGGGLSRSLVVARIAEDRPERVAADVTTGASALLVLTDLHYPGWIAEVDGRRAELLLADGLFRAVAVPAGSHRVVFRYRPVAFFAGAALSILALGVILILSVRGEPPRREAFL